MIANVRTHSSLPGRCQKLTVKAPLAAQVYQIGAELGESSRPACRSCLSSTLTTSGSASISAKTSSKG